MARRRSHPNAAASERPSRLISRVLAASTTGRSASTRRRRRSSRKRAIAISRVGRSSSGRRGRSSTPITPAIRAHPNAVARPDTRTTGVGRSGDRMPLHGSPSRTASSAASTTASGASRRTSATLSDPGRASSTTVAPPDRITRETSARECGSESRTPMRQPGRGAAMRAGSAQARVGSNHMFATEAWRAAARTSTRRLSPLSCASSASATPRSFVTRGTLC
jgi:hypothetical protein